MKKGCLASIAVLTLASFWVTGCTMYTRNEFFYKDRLGFQPRLVSLHAAQSVRSNAAYHRVTRLMVELSKAAPRRWGSINVNVGSHACGLCTDGSTVYVNPSFISSFSDAELIGALGHELAHGDLGHIGTTQLVGLIVTGIFRAITKGHRVSDGTVLAHDLTQSFVMGQFSQKQELEADRQGKAYIDALGYDGTSVMISVMGKLQAMGGGHQWANWFASHPAIPERIASLRDLRSASTTALAKGSLPQRSLGLIPPDSRDSHASPLLVGKVEGTVVSISEAADGMMAIGIRSEGGSTTPVIAGFDSTVFLNGEDVTHTPYNIKPGMPAEAMYVFDPTEGRSLVSVLRLTTLKPIAPMADVPLGSNTSQKSWRSTTTALYSSIRRRLGFDKVDEIHRRGTQRSLDSLPANTIVTHKGQIIEFTRLQDNRATIMLKESVITHAREDPAHFKSQYVVRSFLITPESEILLGGKKIGLYGLNPKAGLPAEIKSRLNKDEQVSYALEVRF